MPADGNYIDYAGMYRKAIPRSDPNSTHRSDPEWPGHVDPFGGRGRGSSRGRYSGRGRGGSSARYRGMNDKAEKGRFENGIWMCDCNPRLPAEHFQVKKDSPNKGRWFFTCQRSSSNRTKNSHLHIPVNHEAATCGFYLWEDDAKPRMEAAVLNGVRSEPRVLMSQEEKRRQLENPQTPQKRKRSPDLDGATVGQSGARIATPPRSPEASFASAMSDTLKLPPKRKLPWQQADPTASSAKAGSPSLASSKKHGLTQPDDDPDATASEADPDDEEFFDWPLTGEIASELSRVADEVELNTPRKARKLDAFDTRGGNSDSRNTSTHNGLLTPGTTPAKPTSATSAPIAHLDNDTTPTPARFRDALATPGSAHTASSSSSTLTTSFNALLRAHGITLPQSARAELGTLVHRHEAQLAGAIKGRDIARAAVKSREETVVKLTKRVEGLEGEVAGLKALVSALGARKGK